MRILRWITLLIFVYVGICIIAAFFPGRRIGSPTPRWKSQSKLGAIGSAIQQFHLAESGNLPGSFIDLFPNYLEYDESWLFIPDATPVNDKASENPSHDEVADLLQNSSAFVYLGTNGVEQGIIAHERLDLWDSHRSPWKLRGKIAVLFPNFRVGYLQKEDIE